MRLVLCIPTDGPVVAPDTDGSGSGRRGGGCWLVLRDRHNEREALQRLIAAVNAGTSQVLVMRGEQGVGKTALLDYLVDEAAGCRVARAAGVESEVELAFAGLHQLCAPMLDQDEQLPPPQREALRTAFGLSSGQAPDGFLVGLAVLGLMAEVARQRPLLCVVDDAQWLDPASAQALAFVARRLVAESVALVFAVRGPADVPGLTGLEQLVVPGLPDTDARALLVSALRGPVDERVLDQIVAETRGNPLAILDLPHGLSAAELAGGFGLPGTRTLEGRIEESYRQRFAPLPPQTRELLLVAAIEPQGDPVLLWRAADQLGIRPDAAAPAAEAGLLEIGARVRFHHPLVRSAVYRSASPDERRSAHWALAQATDPEVDPERHACHRAQAVSGPDEEVAAELERSAGRARARGGVAAAAEFLERAAELTPEPARRAQRTLAAAQVRHQAGSPDAALRLLSLAEAGPLDELGRARLELLRAQIAFTVNPGREAPALLLRAAEQLEPLDVRLARDTYLDALSAAMLAGSPAGDGGGLQEVAEAAHAAPPSPQPPRATDLLLDGLATRLTNGYATAMPMMQRALRAFRAPDLGEEEGLRWLWLACRTAGHVLNDESSDVLATRHVQLARNVGALTVLPLALTSRVVVHAVLGELTAAESLLEELEAVTDATGSVLAPQGALVVAAWQGREADATQLIEATLGEVVLPGGEVGLTFTRWAEALLDNSLGRYKDALSAAQPVSGHPPVLGTAPWGLLVELIEAGSRSDMPEHATQALHRLTEVTRASGTDWALGIEARSRALIDDGPAAETAYREAIDRLGRTHVRGELARAHLVYGEWLRRERRRIDARDQLRTAHDMFTAMGAQAFAERAARELLATGETARRRTVETTTDLTPQETQIVHLVRAGLTNSEIGVRLVISPRTVEWHLSRIFGKLGITSRRQL